MEVLLESKFDFDLETLTNTLNSVCSRGDKRVLQMFLKHDAKKMLGIQQYSSSLNQAAAKNNSQAVIYWLEEHPEHDNLVVDPTTVINVSGNGFIDVLIPLVNHIRPSDSVENTLSQCLQIASTNGHKEVVEYLIKEGADVNDVVSYWDDDRSIPSTSNLSSIPLSQLFRTPAADRIGKLSALQAALTGSKRFSCQTDHERTVKVLLAKGANPNEAREYERYPLNIAAEHCTVEIVNELISSGAKTEGVTKAHGTALQAAARRELGGSPIIKALLEANESVPVYDLGINAALNEALSFFETSEYGPRKFLPTPIISVADILSAGPGAVVKTLLTNLPEERADDSRYCLLAQMACIAGDSHCIDLLIRRGLSVNTSIDYYGTALQAASRVGNIEIVERLLESGANVNGLQGAHGTALRAAVVGGNEDLVRILIARGADVNLRRENESESLLCLALESRNHAMFSALLLAGAGVNTKTNNEQRVFIRACKHGDTASIELLLANGVGVNASAPESIHVPYQEATPLNAACTEGHHSVVRLLLDHGADIEKTNDSSATPLIAAIRGNHLLAIGVLLDAGADVNHAVEDANQACGLTPLSEAVEYCKFEVVEELLSRGASIGGPFTKANALARACKKQKHIMAELLLIKLSGTQYEAEVRGEALSVAIKCSAKEMVRLLLEHSVPPSLEMLRQACAVGVLEVVRMLVDTGIDVNEDDGNDAPLLHVAASHSRRDVMLFLIDRGADVMLLSKKYGSSLIAALEGSMAPTLRGFWQSNTCQSLAKQLPLPELWGVKLWGASQERLDYEKVTACEQMVQSFFNAGAEMDITIRNFGNALHLASYMGSETLVRHLLERMEDVNIFGGYFESPLIAGVKGDHPIIVKLLLDRGIDVNRSSPEHASALHCACALGSRRLIQCLLDHGANINAYDDKHGSALTAAIAPPFDPQLSEKRRAVVQLLLRLEPRVEIRECDLLAAASSRNCQQFMSLFFQHDPSVVATEAVIFKVIESLVVRFWVSPETLLLVLEHDGGLGTTPAMLEAADESTPVHHFAAARIAEVRKILREHKPIA